MDDQPVDGLYIRVSRHLFSMELGPSPRNPLRANSPVVHSSQGRPYFTVFI